MQERWDGTRSGYSKKMSQIILVAIPHTAVRTAIFLLTMASPLSFPMAGTANSPSELDRETRGKRIYIMHCAGCHGVEGKGDGYKLLGADPTNFKSESVRRTSDAELLKSIHNGKNKMPAWKIRLSEQDAQTVLNYIRSLPK